jgi:hypothetical protein
MKPLLRTVLIVYTLLYLIVGLVYLLTPWASLHRALQLSVIEPAIAGQLLGVALLGLAALSFHGVFNGAMTAGVARVIGHVTWLAGLVILVWLVAFSLSLSPGYGALFNALGAAVLLVIGLGGVRLARVVRRNDKTATGTDGQYAARSVVPSHAEAARATDAGTAPELGETLAQSPAALAPEPKVPYRIDHPAAAASALSPSDKAARDAAADLPGGSRPPFHG